jgi:hypothetical protein
MTLKQAFATAAAVALGLVLNLPTASAQEKKATPDFTVGNKGSIHLNVKVKAGSVVLEPGMYQLQHAVEAGEHFIAFKPVSMPAGYRHGNTQVAKEASARIKCTVAPLDKKASKTALTLRTNAAGEKEVAEVQVAGESFKHVL